MDKKIKIAVIATFSFLFLFLLAGTAKADCYYFCSTQADCCSQYNMGWWEPYARSSCIVGDQVDTDCGGPSAAGNTPSCSNAANTRYCKGDACPNINSLNGQTCKVRKDCWNGTCYAQECKGKWDASKKWCVLCSGKVKTYLFGTSSSIKVNCEGGCNVYALPQRCESACDASVSPGIGH
jgi:hypothetical protein